MLLRPTNAQKHLSYWDNKDGKTQKTALMLRLQIISRKNLLAANLNLLKNILIITKHQEAFMFAQSILMHLGQQLILSLL
ncbi:hypothetical protein D3C71_2083730 [compost metagenome]